MASARRRQSGCAAAAPARTVRRPHGREIERRAGPASAGSADRRLARIGAHGGGAGGAAGALIEPSVCGAPGAFGFCAGSKASPRRPGAAVAGGGRRWRGCAAGRARLRAPVPGSGTALLLHAADLALELLVAKLQLLDRSGQLPDLGFRGARGARTRSGAEICAVRSAAGGARARCRRSSARCR